MEDNNVVIIITEGDTDYIFYKKLLDHLTKLYSRPKCRISYINIKGVGKFASKVPSKYKNEICVKYPNIEHHIFFAYDTDVFELKQKPPVDWEKIERKLLEEGAFSIKHIKANKMIEDWFLFDIDGICKNLGIKKPSKLKGTSGLDKIQNLFRAANRIYQKGYNSNNFIVSLDINKIYKNVSDQIFDLENLLFIKK